MQYVIMHDPDTRPALIVETCDRITVDRLAAFKLTLYGRGCAHGLLFDPDHAVILRDTFWTLTADALVEDRRFPTDTILSQARGDTLDGRVSDWLSRMATSWADALPDDSEAAGALLYDVVPALSGSKMLAA